MHASDPEPVRTCSPSLASEGKTCKTLNNTCTRKRTVVLKAWTSTWTTAPTTTVQNREKMFLKHCAFKWGSYLFLKTFRSWTLLAFRSWTRYPTPSALPTKSSNIGPVTFATVQFPSSKKRTWTVANVSDSKKNRRSLSSSVEALYLQLMKDI